jgi:hypothetical protein
MKSLDNISKSLENILFKDFKQFIEEILVAFLLPQNTIKRLFSNTESKFKNENIAVYRRAIFFNNIESLSKDSFPKLEANLSSVYRLIILVKSDKIICKDSVTDEMIEFHPEDIFKHINFFTPLIFGKTDDKDLTTTLGFAELVGRLNNSLSLDEENISNNIQDQIIDYSLSLIYISFIKSIVKDNEIKKCFNWIFSANERDYNSLINGLFDAIFNNNRQTKLFSDLPYFGNYNYKNDSLPNINSMSFEISSKILCYDLEKIDPEVLGSLIYKLTQDDKNSGIYGHYTTFTNVAKVLNPLFIFNYERLIQENKGKKEVLFGLRKELLSLTFFDPTNGPGCFLSSALNSMVTLLEQLDNEIDEVQNEKIAISNFVGLVDNALSFKLSQLTLWVSYIQYLVKYDAISEELMLETFKSTKLYKGNQLETDWLKTCPNNGKSFIIGSPVFKGAKKISATEKKEMQTVFGTTKLADTDFSSCWLYKAATYIADTTSQAALVVTNSVCQGSQVPFVWNRIYDSGCEISFAYRSFKWKNSSKFSTGVSVIIVGLGSEKHQKSIKYLFADNKILSTDSIGPYLINSTKTIVKERTKPLSEELPLMQKGNMPYDNQNLLLSKGEKQKLLSSNPEASVFIKKIVGSKEFIQKKERWCIWINSEELNEAMKIPEIAMRIEKVRNFRLSKNDTSARRLADRPYQFREFRSTTSTTLVVPSVSSENRPYIPIGFINEDTIVSNLAFAIYNCEPWIFGLISSRIHMAWIRTVCGNLETRLRYSSGLGYNTFPFPKISEEKKNQITSLVFDISSLQENYSEKSLGELYNDLPEDLKILHNYLDDEVDSCYQIEKFSSDTERIKVLFNLYEANTQ